MIDVKLTVRLGGVRDMLARIAHVNIKETLREARVPTRLDQKDHDRKETGPDGSWPQLASSTRARYARRPGGKRGFQYKLLGRLPKALNSRVTGNSLIFFSRVTKWSMAHQKGAIVGHGARLPRRQFLWISPTLKRIVRIMFERALKRAAARSL